MSERLARLTRSAWPWRWIFGALAAVLPPGLSLAGVAGIWAVSVGMERAAGIVPAALLGVGALGANLVIYAAL